MLKTQEKNDVEPEIETDVVKRARDYVAMMERLFGGKGRFPEARLYEELCAEIEKLRSDVSLVDAALKSKGTAGNELLSSVERARDENRRLEGVVARQTIEIEQLRLQRASYADGLDKTMDQVGEFDKQITDLKELIKIATGYVDELTRLYKGKALRGGLEELTKLLRSVEL